MIDWKKAKARLLGETVRDPDGFPVFSGLDIARHKEKVARTVASARPGGALFIDEAALIGPDSWKRLTDQFQAQSRMHRPVRNPIKDLKTADLIMELLERGFVAMKLPEGGGLPAAIKGAEVVDPDALG